MRIAVAVSGGTDSTFTLELLRGQGHDVLAVHGHFLPPTPATLKAAEGLAAYCGERNVPFTAVDLSDAFRTHVVEPFIAAYAEGRTPNPCSLCNPAMKFGLLFDAAREHGATHIATGHYARLAHRDGTVRLMRGADPAKDQSYFLSLVPAERLAKAVLPLGDWTKEDVKAELAERGVTPPLPSESQEICFIPDDDYCAFLENEDTPLPGPGPITLPGGKRLGTHKGLWRYTLGQRRGIGVAYSEPLYVVGKDVDSNTLVVDGKDGLTATGCSTINANLLVPRDQWPDTILAQTRYRQKAKPVRAELSGPGLAIEFIEPQTLPSPGQVATLFAEDGTVLAGGLIA